MMTHDTAFFINLTFGAVNLGVYDAWANPLNLATTFLCGGVALWSIGNKIVEASGTTQVESWR